MGSYRDAVADGLLEKRTRWKNQQAQAEREGFRNAWAMRKAKRKPWCPPNVAGPIVEPKTRFDRLGGGNGPVRHLVAEGVPLTDHGAELLNRTPSSGVLESSTIVR